MNQSSLNNAYEICTYTDRDNFLQDNIKIGECSNEFDDFGINNICFCELYQNKESGKFSLFITRDNDEQWIVFKIK